VPSSLPRWTKTSASIGFFLVSLRPSPYIGPVGIHNFTFEACSMFTLVMARRFAARLSRTSVPGISAGRSSHPTVQVATEMNRQLRGWNSHPLASCPFVAHQYIGVFRPNFFLKSCFQGFSIRKLHSNCKSIFSFMGNGRLDSTHLQISLYPPLPRQEVGRSRSWSPLYSLDRKLC
jgi:hypothetical protein